MEKFNLSVWLQDKSRKVVTRSGHNVRILCTDQRGNMPIVALVEFETLDGVQIFYSDGKNESHREYDLFFADEEEELTEFEKELNRIVTAFSATHAYMDETEIHHYSKGLLDLARKELEKDIYDNGCRMGYDIGKQDALKDLPKWKKITKREQNYLVYGYLSNDEYYLSIKELIENLPK